MAGKRRNEQLEDTETITKTNQKEISTSRLWNSIAKNYEMIQGAQLSNSFILLMALNEAKEPLTTTQICELISKQQSIIMNQPTHIFSPGQQRNFGKGYYDGYSTAGNIADVTFPKH
jgi:hypothetical protein